ncbi:hypothetical protein PPROV_000204700 [Pycnococcus provasolii]|uniref:Holocytochrome c-type synthase n=2 Tax=Pycnococcus provasolii TaxID=41880 RepID=A0A830H9K4_9CHLO|nr:hypothetical protein PPROV_000204700 [Pycnococcus provasolii]
MTSAPSSSSSSSKNNNNDTSVPWSVRASTIFKKAAASSSSPSSSSPDQQQNQQNNNVVISSSNRMPTNLEATSQASGLSTSRVTSHIPVSPATQDNLPKHQDTNTRFWQYPSESMFFAAMRRKGWDPDSEDMKSVVAIHNAVNERCWHEVSWWEARHESTCPSGATLRRFQGRPKDYSPKARLLNLLGYKLPFDRHDWYVDRCGREVRYVIDFYNAAVPPGSPAPAAVYLDVRPALDSVEALVDRVSVQLGWMTSMRWMAGKE